MTGMFLASAKTEFISSINFVILIGFLIFHRRLHVGLLIISPPGPGGARHRMDIEWSFSINFSHSSKPFNLGVDMSMIVTS